MEKLFAETFKGLERTYGYIKNLDDLKRRADGKVKADYGWAFKPITEQDYIDHLHGKKAVGIVPINDSGECFFGAIDIDNQYIDYHKPDYRKYLEAISKHKLPIIPVKSKSGGLHLYLFLQEAVEAEFVRKFFGNILFVLGLKPGIEIYPKQTILKEDDDGSFINIPYFNKEERVGLNLDGTEFSFEQFMQVVQANKKTKKELEDFSIAHVKSMLQGGAEEFFDGPPCLQKLTQNHETEKLSDGRDRFLYNYMVFAKKKYPDTWEKKILEAARNYIKYDNDWGDKEVITKVKAWKKETKGHTCNDDPIVNVCMKEECRVRKFGYLSDKRQDFPALTELTKITYPEPEYTFNVALPDGQKARQVRAKNIKQIILQEELRAIISAGADFVPPKIKGDAFQLIMETLFPPKKILSPPKGTTPEELLLEYLKEYSNGSKATTFAAFKTGATLVDGDFVYFKYKTFYDHLKNKDWKKDKSKTAEDMKELFEADFANKKRFPKKDSDSKEHPPIEVVKVPKKFMEEDYMLPEEIEILTKEEIM